MLAALAFLCSNTLNLILTAVCSAVDHRRWIFPCDDSDNKISEMTQEVQTQQTLVEKVLKKYKL